MSKENAVTPDDPLRVVKHTKHGIWDYYEEEDPDAGRAAFSGYRKSAETAIESLPYVVRAVKEVISLPGCMAQMAIYVAAELGGSLVPALSIW